MAARSLRLILNGKKSSAPLIREAVDRARKQGHTVDVRVTWEGGDAARLAKEALRDQVDVIVAGGGDGTVNEVVNGIFDATHAPEVAMAVMPLGSANDFARGCGISVTDPVQALQLAASGHPTPIDVAQINDHYFMNTVIAGFGAEVTFKTSERMKKVIHGAAYGLTGSLMALKQTVYRGRVRTQDGEREGQTVFAAISNGLQAGGVVVAPRARLNDGLIDLLSVPDFSISQLPAIIRDLQDLETGEPKFIRYEQLEWIEFESDQEIPLSPDGEEWRGQNVRVHVLKQVLPFVLPPNSPLVAP